MTSAHDDDHGKSKIAWNDEQAREQLIEALVRDALGVVQALGEVPPGPAADAVGLLALVAGQDVELIDPDLDPDPDGDRGSGHDGSADRAGPRWRIARKVAPEPGLQHRRPAGPGTPTRPCPAGRTGSGAHLAIEPDTWLVTACQLAWPTAQTATTPSSASNC